MCPEQDSSPEVIEKCWCGQVVPENEPFSETGDDQPLRLTPLYDNVTGRLFMPRASEYTFRRTSKE